MKARKSAAGNREPAAGMALRRLILCPLHIRMDFDWCEPVAKKLIEAELGPFIWLKNPPPAREFSEDLEE